MARSQTIYQIHFVQNGKDAPMVYQAGTEIVPAKPAYYKLPYAGVDGWLQTTPNARIDKPVLWSCAGKWIGNLIVWGPPVRLTGMDAHMHVLYADNSPLVDYPNEITTTDYHIVGNKLPLTANEQYILITYEVKTEHTQFVYLFMYGYNIVSKVWIETQTRKERIEASTGCQKVKMLFKLPLTVNGHPVYFRFYHSDSESAGSNSVSYEISIKNISVMLLNNFNTHSGNYRGEYTSFDMIVSENPLQYNWNQLQGSQGASLFFAGVWDPDIDYVNTKSRIDWVKYRRSGKWEFYERKSSDAYVIGTPPYNSATSKINPGWKFIEEQQLKYVRSLITEHVQIINDLGDVIAGVNKDEYAFWSGAELPQNSNFWVDKNGQMHAKGGSFNGNLSGADGTFTTLQSITGAIRILLNQWGISINDNNNPRKYININPSQFVFSTIGGSFNVSSRRFYTQNKDKLVYRISGLPTISDSREIHTNEIYTDESGYLRIKQ